MSDRRFDKVARYLGILTDIGDEIKTISYEENENPLLEKACDDMTSARKLILKYLENENEKDRINEG